MDTGEQERALIVREVEAYRASLRRVLEVASKVIDTALEAWVQGRQMTDDEGRLLTETMLAINRLVENFTPESE